MILNWFKCSKAICFIVTNIQYNHNLTFTGFYNCYYGLEIYDKSPPYNKIYTKITTKYNVKNLETIHLNFY